MSDEQLAQQLQASTPRQQQPEDFIRGGRLVASPRCWRLRRSPGCWN